MCDRCCIWAAFFDSFPLSSPKGLAKPFAAKLTYKRKSANVKVQPHCRRKQQQHGCEPILFEAFFLSEELYLYTPHPFETGFSREKMKSQEPKKRSHSAFEGTHRTFSQKTKQETFFRRFRVGSVLSFRKYVQPRSATRYILLSQQRVVCMRDVHVLPLQLGHISLPQQPGWLGLTLAMITLLSIFSPLESKKG